MRVTLLGLLALLHFSTTASAQGLLVPIDTKAPPLAMVNHEVKITIEDQAAVTHVVQTFRNHSGRQLEATYVFPVPKGASVRTFSMWVNGKEEKGELLEAAKARQIYTSIVRQTLDPGLLEYVGNDLLRLRVFPVPPWGDQKISLSFTSLTTMDGGMVEYIYPLKSEAKAFGTLEKFGLEVHLKSQNPIHNIYSPTHAITMVRRNDKEAVVLFAKDQAVLDKDFQLYYASGAKDVGLTALMHRPFGDTGNFLMLISPRAELAKTQEVPRDMVLVLDTSGSMSGKRMEQARNALRFCLDQLGDKDRFAIVQFATTVTKYSEHLQVATPANRADAHKWVNALQASGGTAINDALIAALQMRTDDVHRPFTIAFFTDGLPTVGQTNPDVILSSVMSKNSANTRIFTFGVGDNVNAALLDQLADKTRAVTNYVRETEDIEARVSSLWAKVSNPVLTDLKLTVGEGVKLFDVFPPQLPDLFHGSQLVVLGKFQGQGSTKVSLSGRVGKEAREFVYEIVFPKDTAENKGFVEDLWARRKVGFLLDQVRLNGEKKELVEEIVLLARRYGITTPYTSYLVVPDDIPRPGLPRVKVPPALGFGGKAGGAKGLPLPVVDLAKQLGGDQKKLDQLRRDIALDGINNADKAGNKAAKEQKNLQTTFERAQLALRQNQLQGLQSGNLGVELSVQVNNLRNQSQLTPNAVQRAANRNLVDIGGVWIDDGFDAKMKTVIIKAQSDAYFRLLERQHNLRDLLRLGNHLVYVTPSGDALVIDASNGLEAIADAEIDRLFRKAKK